MLTTELLIKSYPEINSIGYNLPDYGEVDSCIFEFNAVSSTGFESSRLTKFAAWDYVALCFYMNVNTGVNFYIEAHDLNDLYQDPDFFEISMEIKRKTQWAIEKIKNIHQPKMNDCMLGLVLRIFKELNISRTIEFHKNNHVSYASSVYAAINMAGELEERWRNLQQIKKETKEIP